MNQAETKLKKRSEMIHVDIVDVDVDVDVSASAAGGTSAASASGATAGSATGTAGGGAGTFCKAVKKHFSKCSTRTTTTHRRNLPPELKRRACVDQQHGSTRKILSIL